MAVAQWVERSIPTAVVRSSKLRTVQVLISLYQRTMYNVMKWIETFYRLTLPPTPTRSPESPRPLQTKLTMNRWATFKASFCLSETALGANKTKDIRIAQRDLDELSNKKY